MKTKTKLMIAILAALGFFCLAAGDSGIQPVVDTRDVMKSKLHLAQGVLEGIATENYPLIRGNAVKLHELSQSADWNIRQTPEYQRFTADFSRQAVALEKAAGNKNLDAATMAYFQMTVSCVECHKYLRGVRQADWGLQIPRPKSGAAAVFER